MVESMPFTMLCTCSYLIIYNNLDFNEDVERGDNLAMWKNFFLHLGAVEQPLPMYVSTETTPIYNNTNTQQPSS